MIKFKNNKIRVRCLECKEEHFIEMEHISTDKEQRTLGFEYEHIYRGNLKCSHCGEEMILLTTIFEYPKEFLNYHETNNESCLVMDDITNDFFEIIKNENNNKQNNKVDKKLHIHDVIESLKCDYMITTHDSVEEHFSLENEIVNAKNIYQFWSNGESVLNKNTRIYLVVDITDDVKNNKI